MKTKLPEIKIETPETKQTPAEKAEEKSEELLSWSQATKIALLESGFLTMFLLRGISASTTVGTNIMLSQSASDAAAKQLIAILGALMSPFTRFIQGFWIALFYAFGDAISKLCQQLKKNITDRDLQHLVYLVNQVILVALLSSIIPALIFGFLSEPILKLFTHTDLSDLQKYYQAYAPGLPALFPFTIMINIYLWQKAKKPTIEAIVATAANGILTIAFGAYFILKQKLQYQGLGLSTTVAGWTTLAGLVAWQFYKKDVLIQNGLFQKLSSFKNYNNRSQYTDFIEKFKKGIEKGLRTTIDLAGLLLIVLLMNFKQQNVKNNLAASHVSLLFYFWVFIIQSNSLRIGSTAIKDHKGNIHNAARIKNVFMIFGVALILLLLAVVGIFPDFVTSLFLDTKDEALKNLSGNLLMLTAIDLGCFFVGFIESLHIEKLTGKSYEFEISVISNAIMVAVGSALFFATNMNTEAFFVGKLIGDTVTLVWSTLKANTIYKNEEANDYQFKELCWEKWCRKGIGYFKSPSTDTRTINHENLEEPLLVKVLQQ